MEINAKDRILFEGDFVTDCGRDRADLYSFAGYGKAVDGYAIRSFFSRSMAIAE